MGVNPIIPVSSTVRIVPDKYLVMNEWVVEVNCLNESLNFHLIPIVILAELRQMDELKYNES